MSSVHRRENASQIMRNLNKRIFQEWHVTESHIQKLKWILSKTLIQTVQSANKHEQ